MTEKQKPPALSGTRSKSTNQKKKNEEKRRRAREGRAARLGNL
jgi:hypothetical protein